MTSQEMQGPFIVDVDGSTTEQGSKMLDEIALRFRHTAIDDFRCWFFIGDDLDQPSQQKADRYDTIGDWARDQQIGHSDRNKRQWWTQFNEWAESVQDEIDSSFEFPEDDHWRHTYVESCMEEGVLVSPSEILTLDPETMRYH